MSKESRALVPVGKYALMQGDAQKFATALMRNIGPQGLSEFDLDRITVPTGAVTIWEVPSVDGPQHKETFEGIILAFKDTRRFWKTSFEESGGGSPPDCSSDDGVTGQGNPGGDCMTCPNAQWSSDPRGGPGQACSAVRVLFVTLPEEKMPYVVPLPATSLKAGRKYFLRLTSRELPFFSVVTRFSLAPAQNKAGIKHSVVTLDPAGQLSERQIVSIRKIADALGPVFERFAVTDGDFRDGSDAPEQQAREETTEDPPSEPEPETETDDGVPQDEPGGDEAPSEEPNDAVTLAAAQAEAAEAEAEAVEAEANAAKAKAKAAKAKAQALSAKAEAERAKKKKRKKASKKKG